MNPSQMNKGGGGGGGGKVFEDADYFHDPTRAAKAAPAQHEGGGKDGGRPPPSLSAPASACHSPLADPAPENGFPNPIPAATEENSASNRSNRKTSTATAAATATITFARLFEHVKRTMKDKVMNVKKGGGGHERENKMLRELFKQVEVQQEEEERVVEACKCWLSTTAGLIPGDLFISTHRLAFCSHKSINLHSSTHGIIAAPYKVSIPLHMIQESASNSISISNPPDKFLKIVTLDNYDFWFKVNSNHTLAALSNSILSSASSASLPA